MWHLKTTTVPITGTTTPGQSGPKSNGSEDILAKLKDQNFSTRCSLASHPGH